MRRLDTPALLGQTGPVRGANEAVGREVELARLALALDETEGGRGSVVCVCAEAGGGKSHLAEAFAVAAEARDAAVAWGRCWESGEAPPLWPWVQVLRALVREDAGILSRVDLGPGAAALGRLIPEARVGGEPLPDIEPAQARFAQLDAMASLLAASGRTRPVAVILEDLHAADPASLQLLEFVTHQAPATPVVVLATFREPECREGAVAQTLGRLARQADVLSLRPLGAEAVGVLARATLGGALGNADAEELTRITGGNPLYVIELLRRFGGGDALRRALADAAVALPEGVRSAIRERLAGLPEVTRRCLELAAGCGRQFGDALVATAADIDAEPLLDALAPAVDASVLRPVGAHEHRFSHVLVREVLYRDLGPGRRREIHRRLAEAIERSVPEGGAPPWNDLAMHLERAGPTTRDRAASAFVRAADDATRREVFDEAAVALARAVSLLPQGPGADPAARCDLLLRLADAQLHAGAVSDGEATSTEAVTLARALGDRERLARGALIRGTVFRPGNTDADLVTLLQEALDGLGPGPTPLRARLLARLAAARQPEIPPDGPIELARRAIDLARRLGDPATLLEVLRAGISAMMDLGEPAERARLNDEHIELAQRARRPVEQLRGLTRRFFDHVELGDLASAEADLERARLIADGLRLTHYRWRITAMGAAVAAARGDAEAAWRQHELAVNQVASIEDDWAGFTLACQRLCLWRTLMPTTTPPEEVFAAALEVPARGGLFLARTAQLLIASVLARLGHRDDPRLWLPEVEPLLAIRDVSFVAMLVEIAAAKGDRGLLERVYPEALVLKDRNVSFGMAAIAFEEPVARVLGIAAAGLGRYAEAWEHFAHAQARAEAMGAPPHLARVLFDHARARRASGRDDDLRLADGLTRQARVHALAAGMQGLVGQIDAPGDVTDDPSPVAVASVPPATALAVPRARVALRRDGETWIVEGAGSSVRLRDSKGLRLLARLVDAPGRELHVLDLEHEEGAAGVDRGDAGELLDDRAREQYRARVELLREELEEAEGWGDAARAERARAELESLQSELARAVGLGGRSRRTGAAAERARVNIQRRLRDALRRVAALDEELGRHFEWAVRTGTYCCYDPR